MQALFISSNAVDVDCGATIPTASWDDAYAVPLTVTPQTYTASLFAEQTPIGNSNGDPDPSDQMVPTSFRGMCFRVTPPAGVTFPGNVLAHVTITASSIP